MKRRQLLRAAGVALSVPAVGAPASATRSNRQSEFDALGRVGIDGASEAVVGDDRETVYVAATDGFATVDVSDPADPTVLAEDRNVAGDHPSGPLFSILDVKVDGDQLLVSGPAQQGPLAGFTIYDVSDPAAPEPVTDFRETEFPIHNAYLEDGYVYLTGNDISADAAGEVDGTVSLVVFDVSDDPTEVARWSLTDHDERWAEVNPFLRYLHDVYVQDGLAYLSQWDAGTYVVDVSDPTDPSYVTHVSEVSREELAELEGSQIQRPYIEPPGNDHYAMPNDDGSLLVVGREAWALTETSDGGPAGIDIYDLSDPAEPTRLSRIEPPETDDPTRRGTWTTSHNFDVVGDRLYSSWYQGGVKVHDISDPTDPVEIAAWRDDEETSFWTAKLARPGEFFVASSRDQGQGETFQGLYTFPDEGGEQPTPTEDGSNTETDTGDGTADGNETATETPTPAGTETPDGADAESADEIPGFGGAAALVGLSLGAAAARRRATDDDA